jgi:hypothetical protein
MRWAPGTVVVLFIFAVSLYPQSSYRDLTRRDGVLAKVLLKACDRLTTTPVDFDGTGDAYQVEWWRCGSKTPNWNTGEFPVHYVLIRPPKNESQVHALTLGNSGTSDEYFIDRLDLMDIPGGSRQLLLISGKYYETSQGKVQCVLMRIEGDFQCSSSIEPRYYVQQQLRIHEKNLFRKVDDYLKGR